MLGNMVIRETQLYADVLSSLGKLLPPTWQSELQRSAAGSDRGEDARLIIRTPQGAEAKFVVTAKLSTNRAGVRVVIERILELAGGRPAVIITDYANPSLRQRCEEAGVSYLDPTGWTYLRDDRAGLFVREQGALKPPGAPVQRGTAMGRLDGPGAGQVIRTLWGVRLPIGVRELAAAAGVVPGTVSKVLPTLASYGAIERSSAGAVTAVDRHLLIERWTQDYGIFTTNLEVLWLLSPRGPAYAYAQFGKIREDLDEVYSGTSETGYLGAAPFLREVQPPVAPVIPLTLVALYTENPRYLRDALDLREATRTTANVVLIRPKDAALLQTPRGYVPLPQVIADLTTMGGRFVELAEQLLEKASETSVS